MPTRMESAKTRGRELLASLLDASDQLSAMHSALSETVPGFESAYQRHLSEILKSPVRSMRSAAIAGLFQDLEQAIQESLEASDEK